jgi:hypothetical protein
MFASTITLKRTVRNWCGCGRSGSTAKRAMGYVIREE